jgi:parallel beta-helix repeat protein
MQFRGEPGAVLDGQGATKFAFAGGALGVRIQDVEITGYSSDSTLGAIQGYDAEDWTLQNLNVHDNYGYGALLRNHFTVLGGTFHHNSRLGISVWQGSGGLIDGVDLSFNNPDTLFAPLNQAGGIKIEQSDDVTVHGCHVHDNVGPGIWYDGDNRGSLISGNTVTDNTHVGILYEISYSGVIQGNTVVGNGVVEKAVYGSGILVANSQDVEIHDNVLRQNSDGIVAHRENRGSGAFGVYEVRNLWVHDNDIEIPSGHAGMLDFIGDNAMLHSLNNRFDRNRYDITGNALPFYAGALDPSSVSAWRALGQDQNSTFTGP